MILENLDRKGPDGQGGYAECMQYGVVGYCVPHRAKAARQPHPPGLHPVGHRSGDRKAASIIS
jgi:hypothetical protein